MSFNPYSAFPRQTVFTPNLHQRIQPAINAPDWTAPAATPQRLDNLAGARAHIAARAQALANGNGLEQGVQALYARPSLFEGLTQPVNQMANHLAGNALRRNYRNNQGKPDTSASDDVAERAGKVLESDDSPLSVPGAHAAATAFDGFNSTDDVKAKQQAFATRSARARSFNEAAMLAQSPIRRATLPASPLDAYKTKTIKQTD